MLLPEMSGQRWVLTQKLVQAHGSMLGGAGGDEEGGEVEVRLQEATEILNAATKSCGSYAKPILRHITTVAEVAKKDGVQVC